MAVFDSIKDRVRIEVSGCPEPFIDHKLLSTIKDFCAKSGLWQFNQNFTTTKDVTNYVLVPPKGATILRLARVRHKDSKAQIENFVFDPISQRLIFETAPGADQELELTAILKPTEEILTVEEFTYLASQEGEILVSPEGEILTSVDASLAPLSMFATSLEEDWEETIAAGTKANLMVTPSQSYTNPEMAKIYHQEYRSGRDEARIRATQILNERKPLKAKPQPFV